MKTFDDIVTELRDRLQRQGFDDIFGVKFNNLLERLDFASAKEFLKPEATESEWAEAQKPMTIEDLISAIKDYMPFAWDKANNMRGLSASRSQDHFAAWIWLLDDAKLSAQFDETKYEHYGKQRLIMICEHFGWDWKQWDNGERTNGCDE